MTRVIASQLGNASFEEFLRWEREQKRFMVDTETNVSEWWCERKLILIQFGNGQDEWLLQWSYLKEREKLEIRRILFDDRLKVLHNAYFDCVILRFAGIVMRNVYCTMVAEMGLNCGKLNKEDDEDEDIEAAEHGFFSLVGVLQRRLGIEIDKTEQTGFGDDILTPSKIRYAATDVKHLFEIMELQRLDLHTHDLEFTCALDCASIPGLAEMTYNGMPLDTEAWRANIDLAWPVVQHSIAQLESRVKADPKLLAKVTAMGKYSDEDKVTLNVNSHQQLRTVFAHVFPQIPGTSRAIIRGFMKNNDIEDAELRRVLQHYEAGDTSLLCDYLYKYHRQFLIDNDWLTPAGAVTINWNSNPQVLELFQVLDKKLNALDKQTMSKFPFPIGLDLKDYKDSMKLVTTYGEKFIEKHQEPDGCVRTTFNVIVSTGRLSSRNPNMQNIPAKEAVGNRYRNCFIAEEGWTYVDSDYASQELVVVAYISGDPVWIDALEKGKDLHSVCAEVVYKELWKKAADKDCAYYTSKQVKCNCKAHKRLRNNVKTINFGLIYGMSKFKLSASLEISLVDAEKLIIEYFTRFPKIKKALTYMGLFGVRRGYIQTLSPFFRKRWFPYWKYAVPNIEAHINGVKYDATLGSIERASKNMPVQGSSADMTKVAIWMMHEHIHLNALAHKVKLVMQVHDQLTSRARGDYAEAWKDTMHDIMLKAAKFTITNGLLGAETNITPVWTK